MKTKKLLSIYLIVSIFVTCIALPTNTKAKTIKEYEDEVNKYTQELQEKQNKIAKNDQEVAEIKTKISSIEQQINQANADIERLQQEIDESNKEIEKKTEESKKIIEYYQVANGENVYLEYAFGATDITDLVYRMSIVEQLTEYNDNIMKELQALIDKNKSQQQELSNKKEELNKLQQELKEQKERIDADTAQIKASMPSIEQEIKAAKENVKYYKSLGCGSTEDILKCQYRIEQSRSSSGGSYSSVPSTNGFYRPTQVGYITQGYGGYGGHLGIDVGNRNNPTIEIYPIADGQVFKIYKDSYGALCVKIRHNYNGRYIYSTYAHLSSWGNISEGQNITADTVIGRMGNTGYSFGNHLHLEITSCDWNRGGGCTWYQYQRSTINPFELISFPSSWNNR